MSGLHIQQPQIKRVPYRHDAYKLKNRIDQELAQGQSDRD
jgi:hypothetical protein